MHSLDEVLLNEGLYVFASCESEVMIGDIRPDILATFQDADLRKLGAFAIEIKVTHPVDYAKTEKIERLNLLTLEVDMADLRANPTIEAVSERILHDTKHKTWIYFPGAAEARTRLRAIMDNRIERDRLIERKKRDEAKKRSEARNAGAQAKRQQRRDQRSEYRELPDDQKENRVRKRLEILPDQKWPYFLNLKIIQGVAIPAPQKIWQGAVFGRFIYKMRTTRQNFLLKDVVEWVQDCFDVPNDQIEKATGAIQLFLAYQIACGFVRKKFTQNGPHLVVSYDIERDGIEPFPRAKPSIAPVKSVAANRPAPPMDSNAGNDPSLYIEIHELESTSVLWRASMVEANKRIAILSANPDITPSERLVLDRLEGGLFWRRDPKIFLLLMKNYCV